MVLLISGSTGMAAETVKIARARGAETFTVALSGADVQGDLTIPDTSRRAVALCLERHGRIDALFNCAGISGRRYGDGPLHECTEEGWDMTIAVNVRSMFLLSREVLGHMLHRGGGGSIVNMSSVSAFSPVPGHFGTHAYAASKGAIIAMTQAMAAYYAPHRIRVNTLAPGLVRTPMSARAQENPEILEYMRHKQPLSGGILEPSDIAKAAWFLLSDESQQITGQVLTVDGGWHVSA
jgi:NAD(P)-dependent dehydrogenase (short-subunit alcohol dehydrogenase family)